MLPMPELLQVGEMKISIVIPISLIFIYSCILAKVIGIFFSFVTAHLHVKFIEIIFKLVSLGKCKKPLGHSYIDIKLAQLSSEYI